MSLSAWHLSLAVRVCLLRGLHSQAEVWRLIAFFGVGPLPRLPLSDQAVYDRLEQDGICAFQAFFGQLSAWLATRLAPYEDRRLAAFATGVVALDESVLDQVKRWVAWVREVPNGDSRLLPGRLVGLFDVRLQQRRRRDVRGYRHFDVDIRDEARIGEIFQDAGSNIALVIHTAAQPSHDWAAKEPFTDFSVNAQGTLILFDRGYFSFPWLDELAQQGYWYVSRTVGKTSYQMLHMLYQADGVYDALVYLGRYRSDQAAQVARLVCFRVGSQRYSYLTNVLDPAVLSIADIARLYARRWDIELAFRELKEHLGLRLLWSAKLGVLYQQVWASLLLAQLLHAFQVELAARAEVDPFDVSLALLTRYVPRLLAQGEDPIAFLLVYGRAMGVIGPSTRKHIQAPVVPLQEVSYPPPELIQPRQAHYAHRKCKSRYATQS